MPPVATTPLERNVADVAHFGAPERAGSHAPGANAAPQAAGSAEAFASRHIGPRGDEIARMLATVGVADLSTLINEAVPDAIRDPGALQLPAAMDEAAVTAALRACAATTVDHTPMIGLGYSVTITPPVIRRNVLESPAWYTAYTPYQPEISQGRLEALLNFQTVVAELTGLDVANASLLDEATAVAEAVTLMRRASKRDGAIVLVDADVLPQTRAVLATRCAPLGIDVVDVDLDGDVAAALHDTDGVFGVVVQLPGSSGALRDLRPITAAADQHGAMVTVAADLLALTLLEAPGAARVDVAVGSTQRFGVPIGYGGPHAAYMAVRDGLERSLPGRLVGVSIDADGNPAYRLALQTREQHIRREKATSNICTAQVLLAVIAGMYAVWHGPDGLARIAARVHGWATTLADALRDAGFAIVHDTFFDTVLVRAEGRAAANRDAACVAGGG
ncbi:MAG: hypothetical protein WD011_01095, partial [Nitriliruptoraceae bacterium]